TGWLPVNLTLVSSGSPLATLPIDPINTDVGNNYYAYIGGSWVLTGKMESIKHQELNAQNDNGADSVRLEMGSHLGLWSESQGLIGYWRFDESIWTGMSEEVQDSSGKNYHGTTKNSPTTGTGKFGKAGVFDGINDYIIASNLENITTAVTVSMWIKPVAGAYGYVIAKDHFSQYAIMIDEDVAMRTYIGGNNYSVSYVFPKTEWTHIASTYDQNAGKLKQYINGELKGTTNVSTIMNTDGLNFSIGARCNTSGDCSTAQYSFSGQIDDLKIYNRVLSATEIADLAHQ
ncbi:MAG: LamG domain-containing protein, partial [bacterium]